MTADATPTPDAREEGEDGGKPLCPECGEPTLGAPGTFCSPRCKQRGTSHKDRCLACARRHARGGAFCGEKCRDTYHRAFALGELARQEPFQYFYHWDLRTANRVDLLAAEIGEAL